ncbi:MAG TPA: class I SAM-dependent methyltransferase [Methylophilus sp.]
MSSRDKAPVKLEFSNKYDEAHSEQYYHKHRRNWEARLSHARDVQMARKALKLVGEPKHVLDLPCGAGRFWPVLMENPQRTLIAADNSADMLAVATKYSAPEHTARVTTLQTSAFAIDLPDSAVDSIFCMRLMHHIGDSANRLAMLKEFHRVSKDSVILSLWVDGNFKAWKRRRLEKRHPRGPNQNRFIIPAAQIESEFIQAGFQIVDHMDFIPLYAMWRVYVLRKQS